LSERDAFLLEQSEFKSKEASVRKKKFFLSKPKVIDSQNELPLYLNHLKEIPSEFWSFFLRSQVRGKLVEKLARLG
jgi:hypothetical protein